MPEGTKGVRRPADFNAAAVMVGRIATGEVEDTPSKAPGRAAGGKALYFFHYNFCRIHKSLRVTPAMAAGVTDKLMDMGELVQLMDLMEEPSKPRGTYKKRQPV